MDDLARKVDTMIKHTSAEKEEEISMKMFDVKEGKVEIITSKVSYTMIDILNLDMCVNFVRMTMIPENVKQASWPTKA